MAFYVLGVRRTARVFWILTILFLLGTGSTVRADEAVERDENLVVIMTDIHQGTTLPVGRPSISGSALLKEDRFHTACERIATMNPRPACVLLFGDIAYLDGATADYEKAKESLRLLDDAKIPWTAAMGNHDRIENYFTVFPEKRLENEPVPGKMVRVIETPKIDFLLLDTHQESDTPIQKENPGGGKLDEAQKGWLTQKVAEYNASGKPFAVCSHHPGFETGVDAGAILKDATSFTAYLFGHWHSRGTRTTVDGLSYVCFPSSAYAFGAQPLGYTLLQPSDDGKSMTLSLSLLADSPSDEALIGEMTIPYRPFSVVCSDGGNGGYEAFPDVCRLADGRLLAVFYDGWAHVSLPNAEHPDGGRISGCYSEDEGKTWGKPFVLIDTPLDDRDPSLVQLPDGRVLCNWFTYEPVEGQEPHCRLLLAESADAGQTWNTPRLLFEDVPCSSPIRVLSGGRLILPTYVQTLTQHSGSVAYSDDMGQTWSQNILIPNGGMALDAETDVVERADGSLYALQRDKMAFSISTDSGQTWSVSQDVGFPGHSPYLLRLRDGKIVAAFRLPNTSLRFSLDECKTWSENFVVDDFKGAYPSMVELKDGSVLIVYYEEGAGSNIRAKRFRIHGENLIEWLAP